MPKAAGPDDHSRQEILHASSVAYQGRAVLILGASGSGKSALALELMSRGAGLIADDRTIVAPQDDGLILSAPQALQGKIEARGIGILGADYVGPTLLALAVDLDNTEPARLPNHYTFARFGVRVPLLKRVPAPHFVPAILQFLSHGRIA